MELSEIKAAYRIPAAWRDLGLPGQPGKCVPSPLRADHKPSFSVFEDGTRYKDHATGDGGDVFDFIRQARGCNMAEASRFVQDRLGITRPECQPHAPKKAAPKLPPLRDGTADELRELAERRGFFVEALRLAESRGFLQFCNLWGHAAWCITDARRGLFEFRRLDGQKWPAYGRLVERKAHCTGAGNAIRWIAPHRGAECRLGRFEFSNQRNIRQTHREDWLKTICVEGDRCGLDLAKPHQRKISSPTVESEEKPRILPEKIPCRIRQVASGHRTT